MIRRSAIRFGAAALIAWSLALAPCSSARADESGAPFWFSGQFGSLAALPFTPGWNIGALSFFNVGSFGAAPEIKSKALLALLLPGYAPATKLLGGQAFVGLAFGVGRNSVQADVFQSIVGFADLYPFANLAWNGGDHYGMTYLAGGVPVGSYDSQRLANIGIGHAAIDGGGAYTYLNQHNGRELSATLGFTYNFTNSSTQYQNGIDSHLDWAVSQFLSKSLQVGLVGYMYWQLTADSYPTEGELGAMRAQALGTFKSRVASVGGEVGYLFQVAGQQAYLSVRGYWEFWAENRLKGYTPFVTVIIPLGWHPLQLQ